MHGGAGALCLEAEGWTWCPRHNIRALRACEGGERWKWVDVGSGKWEVGGCGEWVKVGSGWKWEVGGSGK